MQEIVLLNSCFDQIIKVDQKNHVLGLILIYDKHFIFGVFNWGLNSNYANITFRHLAH